MAQPAVVALCATFCHLWHQCSGNYLIVSARSTHRMFIETSVTSRLRNLCFPCVWIHGNMDRLRGQGYSTTTFPYLWKKVDKEPAPSSRQATGSSLLCTIVIRRTSTFSLWPDGIVVGGFCHMQMDPQCQTGEFKGRLLPSPFFAHIHRPNGKESKAPA
ncbi:uncharacterized protein LOC129748056 [Uranotaenia lowii]|uniref:uncharacterized protein LOC129748056 n=1 Tax=Uranotaenia lowii TaxID=190385 RepID=UPI00247A80DD|nr:uncharacterized protein LOC129748056 [Uranotaenia lowii]